MREKGVFFLILCFFFAAAGISIMAEGDPRLVLKTCTIQDTKSDGKNWDVGGRGAYPDVFVEIYVGEKTENSKPRFTSRTVTNSLNPAFDQITDIPLTADMKLSFYVYDDDIAEDDLIGSTVVTMTAKQLAEGNISLNFGQVTGFALDLKKD